MDELQTTRLTRFEGDGRAARDRGKRSELDTIRTLVRLNSGSGLALMKPSGSRAYPLHPSRHTIEHVGIGEDLRMPSIGDDLK